MNLVWLLLGIVAVFSALAYWPRIYPRRPLVWLMLAPALASVAAFAPGLNRIVLALDGVILAVALIDLATTPRRSGFSAERRVGRIASLDKPLVVGLTINNLSRRRLEVLVKDGAVEELHPEPVEQRLDLPARSRAAIEYTIRPERRGAFVLGSLFLQVRSVLGLWSRNISLVVESRVHVYPDMQQLAKYAILARTNRLSLMGVRRTRQIGQDNEFERLRDYTPDDNYKHVDWRSTARRNKLTVKDFQSNQSQRIVFMIDCGRMMTAQAEGLSLLDHALNAMLMMSYVALRQGDQVGMLCFSEGILNYVPPRPGMQQMNRMLHASHDRFCQLVESRYDEAFMYLGSRCPKRAMVVLITNVLDEVNAHQIHRYLGRLAGRHLPLGVLLRERRLFQAAEGRRELDEDLYRAAAAASILNWRRQVLADLAAQGVLSLDVFPEQLAAPLVNRYLEVKARHLL